jgi:hypothetical protein
MLPLSECEVGAAIRIQAATQTRRVLVARNTSSIDAKPRGEAMIAAPFLSEVQFGKDGESLPQRLKCISADFRFHGGLWI